MFEGINEDQISFAQDLPPWNDLTKDEISFIRQLFSELKIEPEENEMISIYTDATNFTQFLVFVLRKYTDFQCTILDENFPPAPTINQS